MKNHKNNGIIHISQHSGKMTNIDSISTSSLSNDYCRDMSNQEGIICSKCYSNKLSSLRPFLNHKLNMNSFFLSSKILKFSQLPNINALYFRFNSFGELINENHYLNLCRIANKNPKTQFVLWTKRINIVREFIKPNNLILIYSNPVINSESNSIPNGFDKIFTVYTEENNINCGSNDCFHCLKCYKINEHKHIREMIK